MTRFVGIDPAGLVGLAHTAGQSAERIRLLASAAGVVLRRHDPAVDQALVGHLSLVARELSDHGERLRWRASVIERAQSEGLTGATPMSSLMWLAEFAAHVVIGPEGWRHSFQLWRDREYLTRLGDAEPHAVAEAFAVMRRQDAMAMAQTYPHLIGDLDGAPAELRYIANNILISVEIARLEGFLASLAEGHHASRLPQLLAAKVEIRLAEYLRWLAEGRQILLFDPGGDGRVVEVFGDLDTAESVAVVVPGMTNDISNFSIGQDGFRSSARNLHEAVVGPGVATIAWLGYDTPDGADAVSRAAAEDAVAELARFLVGVDPAGERRVTVVAHSYGSVLGGLAATRGLAADNLVFVGSPGTTLDSAEDALLRPGGRVWAALADGDPIAIGVDPIGSYRWWHGLHPVGALAALFESITDRDQLWHGTNPASSEFGATTITTEGCSGHSSYFEAGALANLALIVEGRYSEVGLAEF